MDGTEPSLIALLANADYERHHIVEQHVFVGPVSTTVGGNSFGVMPSEMVVIAGTQQLVTCRENTHCLLRRERVGIHDLRLEQCIGGIDRPRYRDFRQLDRWQHTWIDHDAANLRNGERQKRPNDDATTTVTCSTLTRWHSMACANLASY